MQLVLAFASDHFWNIAIVASLVAFLIGVYGQIIHSRAVVFGAVLAIALIMAYFLITGEMNSGTAGQGVL